MKQNLLSQEADYEDETRQMVLNWLFYLIHKFLVLLLLPLIDITSNIYKIFKDESIKLLIIIIIIKIVKLQISEFQFFCPIGLV